MSRAKPNQTRVLVVGQTPPPVHGQGVMIERLLNASMQRVKLYHARMAFSRNMDEVGRFGFGKLIHLFAVVIRIIYHRIVNRTTILYYPPAGPNRVPMWRDLAVLMSTRWMFPKTMFHMHASGISDLYPSLGRIERWLFRQAYFFPDAVIRMSELTCDDAALLRAKRDYIIPNCADDAYGRVSVPQRGQADEPLRLLYVGTVCRTKGILVLLEACQELHDNGIPFQLDVVGTFQPTAFEDTVRAAIDNHGLAEHVRLCGQLTGDEKLRRLAEADVFCFPSFYENESFPCVLLEAMSFGLPVISTNWRGIPSIIDDGINGYLVDVKDCEAFATALMKVCLDDELRTSMGSAGRTKFLQRYTVERHVELMEHAFSTVGTGQTDSNEPRPAVGLQNSTVSS